MNIPSKITNVPRNQETTNIPSSNLADTASAVPSSNPIDTPSASTASASVCAESVRNQETTSAVPSSNPPAARNQEITNVPRNQETTNIPSSNLAGTASAVPSSNPIDTPSASTASASVCAELVSCPRPILLTRRGLKIIRFSRGG